MTQCAVRGGQGAVERSVIHCREGANNKFQSIKWGGEIFPVEVDGAFVIGTLVAVYFPFFNRCHSPRKELQDSCQLGKLETGRVWPKHCLIL